MPCHARSRRRRSLTCGCSANQLAAYPRFGYLSMIMGIANVQIWSVPCRYCRRAPTASAYACGREIPSRSFSAAIGREPTGSSPPRNATARWKTCRASTNTRESATNPRSCSRKSKTRRKPQFLTDPKVRCASTQFSLPPPKIGVASTPLKGGAPAPKKCDRETNRTRCSPADRIQYPDR